MDEVKALLRLAWPAILGQLGLMSMGLVDLWLVGPLGKEATAAVGLGNTVSFGTFLLCMGVVHGADPLVAQAYGADRPRTAGTAAARAAVVALLLAVPVLVVHLAGAPLLRLLGQPESVVPLAADYLQALCPGIVPMLLWHATRQLLQGKGVLLPTTITILAANLLNVVAVGALIGGWGPVPALGVFGAGLGTSIVRTAMLLALVAITLPHLREALPDDVVFDVRTLVRVAGETLPVSLQIGLEVWAFNAGYVLAGLLGDTQAAAHTVAMGAASTSFMVPLGISAAAATRVGNLVGAGRDWRRAGRTAVGLGALAMSVPAVIFLTMPTAIARIYATDADVIALVGIILPIAALFQLFDGTQVVSFGVLRGLGDLRVPALFNVVGYWFAGLPLAGVLIFGLGWGLPGMWVGYTCALAIVATLLVARLLRHGRATLVTDPT